MEELVHGTLCNLMLVSILEALERAEVALASVFQVGDRELWKLSLVHEGLVRVLVLVVLVCR